MYSYYIYIHIYIDKQRFSFNLLNIQSDWRAWYDVHKDHSCTRIESVLLSSAEKLMKSALAILPRIHSTNWSNRKHIQRRCNGFVTHQKIMNKVKNSNIDCAQVRWNTKQLFNSNIGIFTRKLVEKNKLLLERIELTHLF